MFFVFIFSLTTSLNESRISGRLMFQAVSFLIQSLVMMLCSIKSILAVPYIKATGCLCVCLQLKISLTALLLWFSFTVQLLQVKERYFGQDTLTLQMKSTLEKFPPPFFYFLFSKQEGKKAVDLTPPPPSPPNTHTLPYNFFQRRGLQ